MTAVLTPSARLDAPALLHVAREDITFTTLPDGRVAIAVRVTNRGLHRSRAVAAVIEAAPLGAFVPWQPLTVAAVPALEPGEEFVLETEARPVRPAPLGDPGRVPPQRLLTALAGGDDPDARTGQPTLPADLGDLLGRSNPHWAGNLNVFIGGRAVERHMARALRVYPGRVNLAMFIVGSGPDSYAFELKGEGADWEAALYFGDRSLLDLRGSRAVPQGEWMRMSHQSLLMLALVPPRGCPEGVVEVHVHQQSTGQEAIVEFSLDPNAAGPGCYTV